jgi:hypothetical protein
VGKRNGRPPEKRAMNDTQVDLALRRSMFLWRPDYNCRAAESAIHP